MALETTNIQVKTYSENSIIAREDFLAVEEPLEISIEYGEENNRKLNKVSITMRTPGEDESLATGFLFTEGIIQGYSEIKSFSYPNALPGIPGNYIQVNVTTGSSFNLDKLNRNFYTTSSCGVCGKASIDAIKAVSAFPNQSAAVTINPDLIYQLPAKLLAAQKNFNRTGGLHASALFDKEGNILLLSEDVGRHNALDKLIGNALKNGFIPLQENILLLSGRASFELLQKASMAGIRQVCAVGAPSSLAVETAQECGITLIGFLKDNRFNVYTSNA